MQPDLFFAWKPFVYDLSLLKETLHKYIDFEKLNERDRNPRLIVTCTDIKKSGSVIFDSRNMQVDADHLVACASFPFYGIAWAEKDGRFLWDGALLSNTPLREIIEVSPKHDKRVYIVDLFPRYQEELPQSLLDTWHRARDILRTDRIIHNVKMSRTISKYLLLKEMRDILNNIKLDGEMRDRYLKIEKEYHKLAREWGAIIDDIVRIERTEHVHFLFEDADFSLATIRKLIKQGEEDASKALAEKHRIIGS